MTRVAAIAGVVVDRRVITLVLVISSGRGAVAIPLWPWWTQRQLPAHAVSQAWGPRW